MKIEAARLEVRDKDKVATFTGNVKVVQGDTTMHCKVLVVFYEKKDEAQGARPGSQPGAPMPAAAPGPAGSSQINRLEAKGNVVVTQKDQTATGDTGLFDMKSNTVTMTGNVLVSQGPNVLRGERLVVDLTTGVSRVDAGKSNGPVRMLIQAGGRSRMRSRARRRPMRSRGRHSRMDRRVRQNLRHSASIERSGWTSGAAPLKACRPATITALRLQSRAPELDSRRA